MECAGSKTEVACVNLFCDKNNFKNTTNNYDYTHLRDFLDKRGKEIGKGNFEDN